MNKNLPEISPTDAKRCWDLYIKNDESIDLDSVHIENAENIDEHDLIPLYNAIEEIYAEYGKEKMPHKKEKDIDAKLIKPFHETLTTCFEPEKLKNNLKFWLWLSNFAFNGSFCKFIHYRQPEEKIEKRLENWGIRRSNKVKLSNVYFYGIWYRGYLMHNPNLEDPYVHAKRGYSKTWRYIILRQDWIKDPEFVVAYLDTIQNSTKNIHNIDLPEYEFGKKLMKEVNIYRKINEIPTNDRNLSLNLLQFLLCNIYSNKIMQDDVDVIVSKYNKNFSQDEIDNIRKIIYTEVVCRDQQNKFRKDVMQNCDAKCVITGETHKNACQACHIMDAYKKGPFTIQNGLFMRSDWHHLFDIGHILINENGKIELNAEFDPNSEYKKYSKAKLPNNINEHFLKWKYDNNKNR